MQKKYQQMATIKDPVLGEQGQFYWNRVEINT